MSVAARLALLALAVLLAAGCGAAPSDPQMPPPAYGQTPSVSPQASPHATHYVPYRPDSDGSVHRAPRSVAVTPAWPMAAVLALAWLIQRTVWSVDVCWLWLRGRRRPADDPVVEVYSAP